MTKLSKVTNGRPFGQWTDMDVFRASTRSLPDPQQDPPMRVFLYSLSDFRAAPGGSAAPVP